MSYDVSKVAADLMVDADDLQEIYDGFFTETQRILQDCEQAMIKLNYIQLQNLFHALKGSSGNLHMETVQKLSLLLEQSAQKAETHTIQQLLPQLRVEIQFIAEQVSRFYQKCL